MSSFVRWYRYFHEVKDRMFLFNEAKLCKLNKTFYLSPNENILITIHYLYNNESPDTSGYEVLYHL